MKNLLKLLLLLAVVGLGTNVRAAETYGFDRITNNSSVNPEGQFFVDVSDAGSNQVLFHFRNVGPIPSSICDIYFDNGTPGSTLVSIASIADSGSGVKFGVGANPGNLPGGNDIGFDATVVATKLTLSADSDSPVAPNGVNPPDEWLNLTLNLASGRTFGDTLTALGDGTLRVGVHVQAIGTDGESDSFVNVPPIVPAPIVPAPGAIVLGSVGVMFVGWLRRRKSI